MKNSVRSTVFTAALLITAGLTTSPDAAAVEPPVNTGATSFMDGFGDPRGSGFSYIQYARFSSAGSVKDWQGNGSAGNPRLNVFADLNQFLYTFKTDSWVIHPGVHTIVPLVALNYSANGGPPLQDNGFGLGDMVFGTYGQFSTVMVDGRPVFANRLDFSVIAPTGKYDASALKLSPGMNTWSLNPSWAATVLPLPRLEISSRLNYLYNFQNSNVQLPGPT
ncbi:MAG: transporter, partial [Myxococcales bacterium]|nr:transporter [Myxococcales bacterium]